MGSLSSIALPQQLRGANSTKHQKDREWMPSIKQEQDRGMTGSSAALSPHCFCKRHHDFSWQLSTNRRITEGGATRWERIKVSDTAHHSSPFADPKRTSRFGFLLAVLCDIFLCLAWRWTSWACQHAPRVLVRWIQ